MSLATLRGLMPNSHLRVRRRRHSTVGDSRSRKCRWP